MKILYVASIMHHINAFHIPFLKMLKDNGWEVHVAANNDETVPYCDKKFILPIQRSPYELSNILAYKKLKQIIHNERYDIVHCHTPVASILTRLAAQKMRKNGLKVYYTAHGFHFYKGSPLIGWLFYFPIEWLCSFITDVLITINHEDYKRAKKYMHAKKVVYIPGVGIDTKKFSNIAIDIDKKRKELGLPSDAVVLLSVGELNKNKNHETIIRALSKINNEKVHYCIAGTGRLEGFLRDLARKLGVSKRVHLLGYRSDVATLYLASDVFVFPSKREGLPVALMEAMASGLPVICSHIRGNTDLVEDYRGGYLFSTFSLEEMVDALQRIISGNMNIFGSYNKERSKDFSVEEVMRRMKEIYENIALASECKSASQHRSNTC